MIEKKRIIALGLCVILVLTAFAGYWYIQKKKGKEAENPPPTAVVLNLPTEVTANSILLSWSQNTDEDFANFTQPKPLN